MSFSQSNYDNSCIIAFYRLLLEMNPLGERSGSALLERVAGVAVARAAVAAGVGRLSVELAGLLDHTFDSAAAHIFILAYLRLDIMPFNDQGKRHRQNKKGDQPNGD